MSGDCKTPGPVLKSYISSPPFLGDLFRFSHKCRKFGTVGRVTLSTSTMGEIDGPNLGPHSYCTLVHLWDLDLLWSTILYLSLLSQNVPFVCLRCWDNCSDVYWHQINFFRLFSIFNKSRRCSKIRQRLSYSGNRVGLSTL